MAPKKRKGANSKVAGIVSKLSKIMATINESTERALEALRDDPTTKDDPTTRKTVERVLRASKKGLLILERLRAHEEE